MSNPPPGAVLALDVGTRTIGVARSDASRTFVFTGPTLARVGVERDAAAIALLCRKHAIVQLLVGLPLAPDTQALPAGDVPRGVRLARQVGEAVARLTGLPVAWVDESFTTLEANDRLRAAGAGNRAARRVIDGHAASVFLEDWLGSVSAGPRT